jgi:hypothetical protein
MPLTIIAGAQKLTAIPRTLADPGFCTYLSDQADEKCDVPASE